MNTQVTNSVKTQAVDTWLNPKPQCVCVCVCVCVVGIVRALCNFYNALFLTHKSHATLKMYNGHWSDLAKWHVAFSQVLQWAIIWHNRHWDMVGTLVTICCLCTFYATDAFESAADKTMLCGWGGPEFHTSSLRHSGISNSKIPNSTKS
jgi:hypothetical protein